MRLSRRNILILGLAKAIPARAVPAHQPVTIPSRPSLNYVPGSPRSLNQVKEGSFLDNHAYNPPPINYPGWALQFQALSSNTRVQFIASDTISLAPAATLFIMAAMGVTSPMSLLGTYLAGSTIAQAGASLLADVIVPGPSLQAMHSALALMSPVEFVSRLARSTYSADPGLLLDNSDYGAKVQSIASFVYDLSAGGLPVAGLGLLNLAVNDLQPLRQIPGIQGVRPTPVHNDHPIYTPGLGLIGMSIRRGDAPSAKTLEESAAGTTA